MQVVSVDKNVAFYEWSHVDRKRKKTQGVRLNEFECCQLYQFYQLSSK